MLAHARYPALTHRARQVPAGRARRVDRGGAAGRRDGAGGKRAGGGAAVGGAAVVGEADRARQGAVRRALAAPPAGRGGRGGSGAAGRGGLRAGRQGRRGAQVRLRSLVRGQT
eukprot:1976504-Rhodomonas_salina.4